MSLPTPCLRREGSTDGGERDFVEAGIAFSILWFRYPCCLVAKGSHLWDGKL